MFRPGRNANCDWFRILYFSKAPASLFASILFIILPRIGLTVMGLICWMSLVGPSLLGPVFWHGVIVPFFSGVGMFLARNAASTIIRRSLIDLVGYTITMVVCLIGVSGAPTPISTSHARWRSSLIICLGLLSIMRVQAFMAAVFTRCAGRTPAATVLLRSASVAWSSLSSTLADTSSFSCGLRFLGPPPGLRFPAG